MTKPITITPGSFGSFTLVNENDPKYEALGHILHPTHIFRDLDELMQYLQTTLKRNE